MKNTEILESVKDDILNHIDRNFPSLLTDEAKIKAVGYHDEDVRRLCYYFQIKTDQGIKEITYDFRISVRGV